MFKHLLVPLDGSQLAEAVLPAARAWAERLHARLTLLHITEKNAPATIHGEHHLANTREAETYLAALAATLARPGLALQWHVHEAEAGVAQMIVDQAAELKTDLIILNTHGAGLKEKLLGSIAQKVVHEGRVPVLLIRPQRDSLPVERPILSILLPLDGESVHETALPMALELAEAFGATVHLLNVVPTLDTLAGSEAAQGLVLPNAMRAVLDLAQRGGVEYLQRVRSTILLPTTSDVARGDAAKMIALAARKVNADLIIMATHGRMGLDAFWAASVAPKVLNEVVTPLLLARAAER